MTSVRPSRCSRITYMRNPMLPVITKFSRWTFHIYFSPAVRNVKYDWIASLMIQLWLRCCFLASRLRAMSSARGSLTDVVMSGDRRRFLRASIVD